MRIPACAPEASRRGVLRPFIGWLLTWLAVNYAWLYFRIPTFDGAMAANRKIAQWLLHPMLPAVSPALVVVVGIAVVMELAIRFRGDSEHLKPYDLTLPGALARGGAAGILFLAGFLLLVGVPTQQFIYFQF